MQHKKNLTLVLGGMRSGKTAWAEARALAMSGGAAIYLATGIAGDDEMTARINAHRAGRDDAFTTIEEPRDIPRHIMERQHGDVVLVDSLGGWVSNLMVDGADISLLCDELMAAVGASPGSIVFVSEEVGLGVIPENRMARDFIDALGALNQTVAAEADEVVLMVAGVAQYIKEAG